MKKRKILLGLVIVSLAGVAALYRPDTDPADMRAKYANAQSSFVQLSNGQRVHVRDDGPADAPVLVLLHGSNSSLQTWEPWVQRLKAQNRIISMDLPGHGLTGPHPGRDYSADAFVAVVDGVMRAKKIDQFVLGGNSMGGWIAWEYALRHGETLRGLLLIDAGGAPLKDESKKSLPIGFRLALTPGVRVAMEKLTPRFLVEKSIRQSVSIQSSVTPSVIDRYWDLLRYPGNRRATIDRFAVLAQRATDFGQLRGNMLPTLILWGQEDKLIPVESVAVFKAMLSNETAIIYEDVGHLPMEEIPDRSAQDVAVWLKSTVKQAAR
jgi:pimeloyl-ACP methyl ester carboxylesterase